MFKEIPAENANLRPFRTHKNYILGENDISVYKATSASVDDFDLNSIPAFDNNLLFDPINESKTNDFYQRALYQSTLAKYYHPDTKQSPIMGGGRISKFAYGNQRTLGKSIELLNRPIYMVEGDSLTANAKSSGFMPQDANRGVDIIVSFESMED